MRKASAFLPWAALMALTLLPAGALAQEKTENSARLGDVVVHYSAVRSDFFAPQVARHYGFVRSSTRAVLTVSLLRGKVAIPGHVTASAEYPSGQPFAIPLHKIREGDAIYYLGDFRIQPPVTLRFHLDVQTGDSQTPQRVNFDQAFYP